MKFRTFPATILALVAACWTPAHAGQPSSAVRLAPFEQHRLGNGATLLLMEKHDTPLMSMRVLACSGSLGDRPGKEGTASLLAEMLQKGAGTRTAAGFAESIENAGGVLSASAQTESLGLGAGFLARDVDLMVELMADAMLRPSFDPAEFARARTLAIQSIAAAKDADPRQLIDLYGEAWLFRGHPYGRPTEGGEKSLESITLDDLKQYYAEQCGADQLIITVVGDIQAADMKQRIDAAFGGWRKASAPVAAVGPMPRKTGRQVLLVDKPGATQTYFWIGNVGASRADPARGAQTLANTVFGGRFTSMLNTELRIRSGLTYGVSSGFARLRQPGSFSIQSFTQTEKTAEAIDLALATLDRLHVEGIDAQVLSSSRSYVLGQFPPTIETNGQLATRLADIVFFGLDRRDVDEFATRINAADSVEVRASIDRDFPRTPDLAIVLVGDAADIRESVRKYGPLTEIRITDPSFVAPAAD